uniref:Uncharacterized protein n=1 Tax=Strongyloides venezuelensis TaxID=75913 RepID=A0A0K0F1F3_STRVS
MYDSSKYTNKKHIRYEKVYKVNIKITKKISDVLCVPYENGLQNVSVLLHGYVRVHVHLCGISSRGNAPSCGIPPYHGDHGVYLHNVFRDP